MKRGAVLGLLAAFAMAGLGIVITAARQAVQAMPFSPDALYAAQCSSCHGDRMEGGQFGPTLKSGAFRTKWTGKREELFKYISHNMPPNSSGQIADTDYRVLAKFIADSNRIDQPDNAPPEPQRVGHLGPRSAPELWDDTASRQAKSAQAAKLAALTPVTAQMLRTPPAEDWLTWRCNQALTGFSPLDQINRQTVGGLKLKWAWSMKPGRSELARSSMTASCSSTMPMRSKRSTPPPAPCCGAMSAMSRPNEERTGAATWSGSSYDPDLNLLYFGTAGTYDVSSLLDPGPNGKTSWNSALYTNSTIALRPSTGELVWYHQHMPRELWDLDEVFERMMVTVPVNGKDVPAVISIGKMGILDALDRKDGRYLFSFDFGLQNVITAIDPKTGRRTVDPAKIPRATSRS